MVMNRYAGTVDVVVEIQEGRQSVIADITVDGNQKTSERLVREQLELTPAQPLDLGALSRSRKNLYETGAFSIVDITREEIPVRPRAWRPANRTRSRCTSTSPFEKCSPFS